MASETPEQTTNQPQTDVPTASTTAAAVPTSVSDSESDSDSYNEAEQASQLQTLESELSHNPANYDAHVQCIQLLRKMGELDKLRKAREAMGIFFPLTPQMWREWAKDELTLFTDEIWEAYKDFEQAICLTIDESDVEGKEKQNQRIRSLYQRQLSVPLIDMRSTLLAYKTWEVEQANDLDLNSDDLNGIAPLVATAYKKALEMCTARIHLEDQTLKPVMADSDRLSLFKRYLKFEESAGDPARVHILYERAITEFPIAGDLWLDYTCYLDKKLKVFEKALQCTFSSYEEYLDLFLTRIVGSRRRFSMGDEMQVLDYAVIRDTFQDASS